MIEITAMAAEGDTTKRETIDVTATEKHVADRHVQ
jgi:hypothetical protein